MLPALTFGVGVLAAITIIATLVVTLTTDRRLWPPGDERWKAHLHWGLVGTFDICILAVAFLEWNTWILPRPSSLIVGGGLSVVGAAIFLASARIMNGEETTGQAIDELYTDGPYARSRNPQYLGMMLGLLGFVALTNAVLVAVLAGLHVAWLFLLPFAEEPWLEAEFGENYERYRDRVPRFVGWKTFNRSTG